MKIALFGGSFDPFHTDHLEIIKTAKKNLKLDKIWIIPTNQNPFKSSQLTENNHRINMIKLAVKDLKYVSINENELNNEKVSTTIETVEKLIIQYPNVDFVFLIGSDQLEQLHLWNRIDELVKLVQFYVFQRGEKIKLEKLEQYHLKAIPFNCLGLSSTQTRKGEMLDLQVDAINDYINNNLLYLYERLEAKMTYDRYVHNINVGQMAKTLASIHDCDQQQALIAGTLHDVTKRWCIELQREYLKKYAPQYLNEPIATWHAYTGYFHLKHDLLFKDEAILQAVKKHTVASEEMSKLEMIVFVADKISIERNYSEVSFFRELAEKDIEQCFIKMLKFQYEKVIMQNGEDSIGSLLQISYNKWNEEQ